VAGIQRLVAASVPDIVSADVTLLDQHGVALTRLGGGDDGAADGGGQQLDAKRSTEDYLVKKVAAVLDRTFGAGQAVASVDVALSLDHGKVTTEEVLPAKMGLSDGSPTGVVVREKHTVRDADSPGLAGAKPGGGNSSAESDYQVGRRVEQLAIAGGTVRRMTIAVVVKPILSDAQLAQLREVVALAVGFNSQRGDAIVVNSMDRLVSLGASADGQPPAAVPALDAAAAVVAPPLAATRGTVSKVPDRASADIVVWVLAALLLACVAAALAYAGLRRRAAHRPAPALLDEAARARMIVEVRRWIATPSTVDAAAGVRK
jgi:flagellar M-ring protein FliF